MNNGINSTSPSFSAKVNFKSENITIFTNSKKFYSGMTLEQAKQKGIDKKFFGTDFEKIDFDKNGVLSNSEILHEREAEYKQIKAAPLLCGICAIGSYLATKIPELKSAKTLNYIGAGLGVLGGIVTLLAINPMKNSNESVNYFINNKRHLHK